MAYKNKYEFTHRTKLNKFKARTDEKLLKIIDGCGKMDRVQKCKISARKCIPCVHYKISYLGQKLFNFKGHRFKHMLTTQQWHSVSTRKCTGMIIIMKIKLTQ